VGKAKGDDVGWTVGARVGFDGLNVGLLVVGRDVGWLLGWRDGCIVGWRDGCVVGRDVGCRDGWRDGCVVGCCVGWPVGWRDGCIVGCLVGCCVGWPEGATVGLLTYPVILYFTTFEDWQFTHTSPVIGFRAMEDDKSQSLLEGAGSEVIVQLTVLMM